jgi:hypothetical protein
MAFADQANRACLRAFLPYLLDEANLAANRQLVEGVVENAVPMEIDLTAVGANFDTRPWSPRSCGLT